MTTQLLTQLGPYQILGELGHGGMAIVYRGYHPALNRTVAIKVLLPQLASDHSFVQRFMQEARNAARLDHPNIVTIHDVGQADGTYYIVMQEAPGQSLTSLIQREGRLPLARVTKILAQIASALDYAHAQGLVHRDIKPGNIIVGPGDRAILTDFGIAKAAEGTRLTQTGSIVGTPEYMSPEQAKGQPVGPSTDIYALGIVLYEMLVGRAPFKADNTPAVLYKQVHEQPAPLRIADRTLRVEVDSVVARALAKNPSQRYRTATEMAQALAALTAEPGARDNKTRRFAPLLAALTIFAIAVVAGMILWNRSIMPSPAPEQGIGPQPTVTPQLVTARSTTALSPTRMPTSEATPASRPSTPRAIIAQAVNAYAGPGRKYDQAGKFAAGEQKDIIGRDASGAWWQVCCLNGEPVWLDAKLTSSEGDLDGLPLVTAAPPPTETPVSTPTPMPTVTPAAPELTIVDNAVRVRSGPSTSYPVLDTVKAGQRFEIVGKNAAGDWWQIVHDGQPAWVSGLYVDLAGDFDAVPEVQVAVPPVVCSQGADSSLAGLWTGDLKQRIGCPLGSASTTDGAFEAFESGAMIWRKDVLRHYVIANDGGWRSYADAWLEGLPDYSCPDIAPSSSPPTPLRGFGQVWCRNSEVRQRLGNAAEHELAEQLGVQEFERGTIIKSGRGTYVLFSDGGWVPG